MKYFVFLFAFMMVGCTIFDEEPGEGSGGDTEVESPKPDWATNGETVFSLSGEPLFVVAKGDFPNFMTWEEANQACENLGNDWRLPNIDELEAMYGQLHRQRKGNFSNSEDSFYWSSSEYNAGSAWFFSFYVGQAYNNSKDNPLRVRAVRALP
jgi:hypothetical protein